MTGFFMKVCTWGGGGGVRIAEDKFGIKMKKFDIFIPKSSENSELSSSSKVFKYRIVTSTQ